MGSWTNWPIIGMSKKERGTRAKHFLARGEESGNQIERVECRKPRKWVHDRHYILDRKKVDFTGAKHQMSPRGKRSEKRKGRRLLFRFELGTEASASKGEGNVWER